MDHADLSVEFREVTPETWPDFEALFEGRGGPKTCWCMIFRAAPEESRRTDKASRKSAMERRIKGGTPVGILGYLDGEPVGWCSVAPRGTFRRLGTGAGADGQESIWSITCFYVLSRLRRTGMSNRLLTAAIEHARRNGAATVEAYPVEPDSPSYRFGGFIGMYESAGFKKVGMVGTRRHRMRLETG